MKSKARTSVTLMALTFLPVLCRAEDKKSITLLSDEVQVESLVSSLTSTQDHKITARVVIPGALKGQDVPLKFTLSDKGVPGNPALVNPDKSQKPATDTVTCELSIRISNIRDASARDYTTSILLDMDTAKYTTTGSIVVRIVPGHSYNGTKPFWLEVGANFDLASQNIEANNVFGGVFLYQREVRPLYRHTRKKTQEIKEHFPLAVAAGVYESKAFSQETPGNLIPPYYTTNSYPTQSHPDSFLLFTDTGSVLVDRQIRNVGLFFSPQFRLSNKSSNDNGMHFFFSVYTELLWQNIQTNYDYSGAGHAKTTILPYDSIRKFELRPDSRSFNVYSHYDGIGLPVFFKVDDVNLYLNPVYGITNQPSDERVNDYLRSSTGDKSLLSRIWSPFYLVQFRLSEEHYGISFSGEIRQLLGGESKPFVTLVLSKKFDLSKLIEYNGRN